jgi:Uma2 family endonuclease
MSAVRKTTTISIEDYLAGELVSPVKHEYRGGYIYAMAGAINRHNDIAMSFAIAVGNKLRGKKCRPFNSDTKVRIRSTPQTRFYYPDGMIVCQPNPPGDSFQDQPVVIAEVLSDSTRRIDEGEKLESYVTIPSLTTYLLIEPNRPRVVAYRRADHGFVPETFDELDATIELTGTGISLTLAELYENVEFGVVASEGE